MNQAIEETNGANVTWEDAVRASAQVSAEAAHPPKTYDELLPVRLTDLELAERAKKAAAARRRVAEFEAQKKASADHWKAKIELAENERDELLDVIASGVEERNVEVIETFEFANNTVSVTRTDTGEKIRERALTAAERQPDLFDVAGKQQSKTIDDVDAAFAHDGEEFAEDEPEVITDPEAVLEGASAQEKVTRRSRKS